jgi:hypothetical protein
MAGEVTALPFLTSTLFGDEWSASSLGQFNLRAIGGYVGPRTGPDTVEKKNILGPNNLNMIKPSRLE